MQFLQEKQLSSNSQSAYYYDLQQFLDICKEQITAPKIAIYQAFLQDSKPSVRNRKISAVNQFLYFLYEKGSLDRFYKLKTQKKEVVKEAPALEDLAPLFEETAFPIGQKIALWTALLGLTPSELAQLKRADINTIFQVVSLNAAKGKRVLTLPKELLAYMDETDEVYVFDKKGKAYSRQWFFNRLSEYVADLGKSHWTAQFLREQYILRELEAGKTVDEIAKELGLTSKMSLEKYR